jgi:DNA-binding CsgD family transcriptional regulator
MSAIRLLGRRAECEVLDGVLADALAGRSRALVLRGEAGAGKSALLAYASERAAGSRIASAVAVESEMELAYSGLHQLCVPMLDLLDRLPAPQRDALATVFGLSTGAAPDRFLVGLATLTLFAEVAEQQSLVCIVDDAQWLDDASAQILVFVARRLLAERIALVCAVRTGSSDDVFGGLPALAVEGLGYSDARALLLEGVHGPLDPAVSEHILVESHGNPLALLELPRTWDSAGGFGVPASQPVVSKIEESYTKRLLLLPDETRLLVLAAAAEPLGDPVLLHRAVETLGLGMAAAGPAIDAELIKLGAVVEFVNPLVRSAAYRSAVNDDRHRVHRALAEATDPERDPDRRAWHRARGTSGPDEEVAAELERSAARAEARGGLAAAAAFLERAAALSPDFGRRALRALRAAEAKQLAGAPEAASALLAAAVDGPLDELGSAKAQHLKGQIALDLRRGAEAVPFLLDAAKRLEPIEPALARETYLETLRAASISGRFGREMLVQAAAAARDAPSPEGKPRAIDLLLDGLGVRFTDGYAASVPHLKRALSAVRAEGSGAEQDPRWPWFARRVAPELFDDEAWHELATRSVQLARDRGALGVLPLALNFLATFRTLEGDLDVADALLEESDAIAEATGIARIIFGRLLLAGLRGDHLIVSELVAAGEPLVNARSEGVVLTYSELARAILYNGMGQYRAALASAESASAEDDLGLAGWSLPELVEAASRSDQRDVALAALERLTERTRAAGTEWALGVEARSRALVSDASSAEELYREAIDRLGRCRLATERGRAHLVYGEWLRRAGRRVDAREQLRAAHAMLAAIGMEAYAERARRELMGTGERVRRRTAETRDELTAQEAQIAQLAREGCSNAEIGAQLFVSPRTVEWHMRKVFAKLEISSRKDLDAALSTRSRELEPA